MIDKQDPQGNMENIRRGTKVSDLLHATYNLVKGHIWYSERGIGTSNGEWKNIKHLYDQIAQSLDALDRTIRAYDTITKGTSFSEKERLSGEIALLQRGVVLIYGEMGNKIGDEESIQSKLIQMASLLGKRESTFLSVNLGKNLHAKIHELNILETWVMQGDRQAKQNFLDLSSEILGSLQLYHAVANILLKR